jgi:class 3 adenylate cyclase/tetratricopeptide (TPR) repeat protein
MVKCPSCGEENPPKFRLCGYCGTPLVAASAALPVHEVRKTVTIVFCDLKGSTALGERIDAEALHEVKERYFNAMAAEITRHGGKIEKYIGDAIMAVFGLPRAHEDDALRAVRAAVGMQTALGKVNEGLISRYGVALGNRTGINTGEVVANDDPGANQKLATGDAVNVAARLEQAAPENQIYLGEVTYRLVRDAVEVEPVEPLELKGKAERVAAFRVVAARGLDGHVRRHDTPIVGRDEELATLGALYREVAEGRCARMVTVIGDAGVGKSRLVREVLERIAAGARVLSGRCLPYGDGITFWPLSMMVREAAGIREADSPETAQSKLFDAVRDREVAERLASAAGLSAAAFPLQEINWAARKFLEILATRGPVVAFVDDIHWAETAFLDLLEHVLQTSSGAPILLLTTARHDIVEERPAWGTQPNSLRIVLQPLNDEASARVIANLLGSAGLPASVVTRIVRAAGGNPLYAEQMLSMLIDNGALRLEQGQWVRTDADSEIAVPPTIHALLEARLDQLARAERATVEPASVIGLEFAQPAVESLAPEAVRAALPEHLSALARKQFIHPATAAEAIYRFHHQLVRETVYNGLLKRARAQLHIEFVRWADRVNAERDRALEFEEILGYHLEQAHHYLRELGPLDEQGRAIGIDAARRLAAAGRRAFARSDLHAAANLLKRATALHAKDDPQRVDLLPELGETLMGLGDFGAAHEILEEARLAADGLGNQRIRASSELIGIFIRLYRGERGGSEQTLATAHELVSVLEREAAHSELATAWRLIVVVHGIAGRYRLASEAAEHSIAHARLAGNDRLIARVGGIFANMALLGSTPVPQAIDQCERLIAGGLSDRQMECHVMCTLAQLRAMNGELQVARSLYQRGRALLQDLGHHVNAAATGLDLARVELLGGDLALAEREVRADYELLAKMGETYYLSSMAALLSRIVRDQGRDDEALVFSKTAEEASAADDLESQSMWRAVRAPIVARAGDSALAEDLARSAVEVARRTEAPGLQADALTELACVLRLAGRLDDARLVVGEAIALHVAKGNVVAAVQGRAWAAELDAKVTQS